jgi:flagellar biosynthesis protein FliQ
VSKVEILSQYVVVLVVGICLAVGYIIKNSLDFIPNKYIPLIMAILGTFLNIWIKGWIFSPEILLGGMASGLASTGAFELVRNITGKDETK